MQLYYLYATIDPVPTKVLNVTCIFVPAAIVIFGVNVVNPLPETNPQATASTTVACVAINPPKPPSALKLKLPEKNAADVAITVFLNNYTNK